MKDENEKMTSNIIAGLSLVISLSLAVFYIIDRNHTKFLLENEYSNNILHWHEKVVTNLKKLGIKGRDRDSIDYKEDLSELAALIEQGRFFFPNIKKGDDFGAEKPSAYRGYRNLALDFLVSSYNLYSDKESEKSKNDADILQRHFTSIVFEIVNPQDRLDKIQALTGRYFLQEKSYEDFLNKRDSHAMKYIWKTK